MSKTYQPSDLLGRDHPEAPYTFEELLGVLEHLRSDDPLASYPEDLRALLDGRVVDATWDPADDPNPTVWAEEVVADWLVCDRCDADLEPALVRHFEEAGPGECTKCGLALPDPPVEWLLANGYEVPE